MASALRDDFSSSVLARIFGRSRVHDTVIRGQATAVLLEALLGGNHHRAMRATIVGHLFGTRCDNHIRMSSRCEPSHCRFLAPGLTCTLSSRPSYSPRYARNEGRLLPPLGWMVAGSVNEAPLREKRKIPSELLRSRVQNFDDPMRVTR